MKQPPTERGDDFWLGSFSLLSTTRSFPGNGIGPIPWNRAFDYAERQGFGRRMCNFFAVVILVLDGHYRDHLRDEQDKEAKRESRMEKRKAKAADADHIGTQRRSRSKR